MTLKLADADILVCDCGGTMPIDGKALIRACKAGGDPDVATSLCRNQTEKVERALAEAATQQRSLLIACTQETAVFDALASDAGLPAAVGFNIRELAGWSDEAPKATAKLAALIHQAARPQPVGHYMSVSSAGRCLIYGGGEAGMEMAGLLQEDLGVTLMLTPEEAAAGMLADSRCGQIVSGVIRSAAGSFGKFRLVVDSFAEAAAHSRSILVFGDAQNGVETDCDLIIDLSGQSALLPASERRDGYFRLDPSDRRAMDAVARQARQLIGEFEKPIYVEFDENLCAHGRNGITGCHRCLDVCPAGAITSAGQTVAIDPMICGGCGLCGAVCPSGAAQTVYPPAEAVATRMANLLEAYTEAGGRDATLLLHDEDWGNEMIAMMARHSRGLPASVLPLGMHSAARVGHDTLVAAIALGYKRVLVLLNPKHGVENAPVHQQLELAEAMLAGSGCKPDMARLVLIEEADPDAVEAVLYSAAPKTSPKPAPFAPLGSPRSMTRLAMRGLGRANKVKEMVVPLPAGAPYGSLDINLDSCTLCLSCVGACPAGALQDNPDAPQLLFREDACLQCGICVATCPEKVISLVPQFNLADTAMQAQLLLEDEPYPCSRCGKIFGTRRSVERVMTRLKEHSMFAGSGRVELLSQCEDCRVEGMFDQQESIEGVGQRPKPRTTDDYLN